MDTGELVPDFTLLDEQGEERSLSSLVANGPVVLFFYPAAMTKGCTKESCHFRDLGTAFTELGAQRIGISMDDVSTQQKFVSLNSLDYPVLSDTTGEVATLFGVKRRFDILKTKRATFVIGTDRILKGQFVSETNMNAHADWALSLLATL